MSIQLQPERVALYVREFFNGLILAGSFLSMLAALYVCHVIVSH